LCSENHEEDLQLELEQKVWEDSQPRFDREEVELKIKETLSMARIRLDIRPLCACKNNLIQIWEDFQDWRKREPKTSSNQ